MHDDENIWIVFFSFCNLSRRRGKTRLELRKNCNCSKYVNLRFFHSKWLKSHETKRFYYDCRKKRSLLLYFQVSKYLSHIVCTSIHTSVAVSRSLHDREKRKIFEKKKSSNLNISRRCHDYIYWMLLKTLFFISNKTLATIIFELIFFYWLFLSSRIFTVANRFVCIMWGLVRALDEVEVEVEKKTSVRSVSAQPEESFFLLYFFSSALSRLYSPNSWNVWKKSQQVVNDDSNWSFFSNLSRYTQNLTRLV